MTDAAQPAPRTVRLPVLAVLVPFALMFALCNYYRTVNAVLAPHLVADLGLGPRELGLLISVYFLVSALFQVPLGMLMDRYGPRRVQGVLLLIAACGAAIFALGDTWTELLIGRVVMGIGAAGGLMTSIQAVTLWFPSARWPVFNGLVMSIGSLGSLVATLPTQILLDYATWHQVLIGAAIVSVVASLLLLGFVPEKQGTQKNETVRQQLTGLGAIYRDRLFWRFAPMYLVTTGSTMAFQSLWAGPWLRDVVGLDPAGVASHLLVLSLLQIASYFLVGAVATALGRRNVPLPRIVSIGVAIYVLTLTQLVLPGGVGGWGVMVGIGLFANCATLCYPILSRHFPPNMTGRANTALNLFFFVGAFVVQYSIGLTIGFFAPGAQGSYPTIAYQASFGVMLALQASAWLWTLVPARTRIG